MNDDLVEKVARAMYEGHVRRQPTHLPFPDSWLKWGDLDNADRTYRETYRFEAAAAIRVVREEAAKVARLAPHNRGGMICVCSEGLADWTAEAILALGEK